MGRLNQAPEQGMGFAGAGEEFGVKLAGGKERVALQLDQFDEPAIGGGATDLIARSQEEIAVGVVEFVAMAMAFVNHRFAIEALPQGVGHETARIDP